MRRDGGSADGRMLDPGDSACCEDSSAVEAMSRWEIRVGRPHSRAAGVCEDRIEVGRIIDDRRG